MGGQQLWAGGRSCGGHALAHLAFLQQDNTGKQLGACLGGDEEAAGRDSSPPVQLVR